MPDRPADGDGILKAAAIYFALVFGTGFVLGFIRVGWVAPRLGMRIAELIEMPIMLVVIALAARRVVDGLPAPRTTPRRLGVGVAGLGLMLLAEFALALFLTGQTIAEYMARRDPVSGTAYALALLVFVVMPLVVRRRSAPPPPVTPWRLTGDP